MAQHRHPRGEPYRPPADTTAIISLRQLIQGVRTIVPEQQNRLGFDKVGLDMPLWTAGNLALIQKPCVAIVGTRSPSPEGRARARRLARELVQAGVVIVSGLAKGVDTEALTSAIEARGRVIAVIGTPINKAYPAENKRLQESIYRDHLLISQFPPDNPVFPSNFPERNKLMAAISDATAIIEAGETSGTLHQAAECARIGRMLFITRSVVENPELSWPSQFKDSPLFRILTKTEDVIETLRETASWQSQQ